jgi:hypothetical protein
MPAAAAAAKNSSRSSGYGFYTKNDSKILPGRCMENNFHFFRGECEAMDLLKAFTAEAFH